FEHRLAAKGIVPAVYKALGSHVGDLGPKDSTPAFAAEKMSFAKAFVDVCRVATEQLGKDLKLSQVNGEVEQPVPVQKPQQAPPAVVISTTAASAAAPVYDLRGVACPMNYVKTKLKLEMMDAGEKLEVWLDAGDPIRNVPMSVRNDGHKIMKEEPLDLDAKHFKILIEKVEA
ncbi:MAG TPA: sulfurtransferase TusA family protein, partial [Nitrospiraceae bacterium]|nr:sulfurtransferase TusA family protein [Nitrospiraceae bacterium]